MAEESHGHGHGHDPKPDAEVGPDLGRTENYTVAVTLDAAGKQVNGLVFRKPVAGESFAFGDLWVFNPTSGAVEGIQNDDGVIPYRERTEGDGEDLGLTWQHRK